MLSDWLYRKSITIDQTKIDAALTDFPVCVLLTSANFDFSLAQSTGYDIQFIADNFTTLLKYERVSHDATGQTAEYWVRIPSVSATVDTVFYMYYGNSSAADGADPEAVWDENFVMVQHMNDATTSTITDSTQYDNDGTKKGANEPIEAAGKIGKAQSFDGVDDYIQTASKASTPTAFTVTMWWKRNGNSGGTSDTNHQLMRNVNGAGGNRIYVTKDGTNLGSRIIVGGTTEYGADKALTPANQYYVGYTWDDVSNYVSTILDGAIYQGHATSGVLASDVLPIVIGRYDATTFISNGLIDEVRISNTARSAAWIKAEYNAGNNTLLTIADNNDSSFKLDSTKVTDFTTYTMWSALKHTTLWGEIVTKYNSWIHITTGHYHSGVDSPTMVSTKDLEAELTMGVMN